MDKGICTEMKMGRDCKNSSSLAEIKFIIKTSILPPSPSELPSTKKIQNLLSGNDSSFENSMEFKPLGNKVEPKNHLINSVLRKNFDQDQRKGPPTGTIPRAVNQAEGSDGIVRTDYDNEGIKFKPEDNKRLAVNLNEEDRAGGGGGVGGGGAADDAGKVVKRPKLVLPIMNRDENNHHNSSTSLILKSFSLSHIPELEKGSPILKRYPLTPSPSACRKKLSTPSPMTKYDNKFLINNLIVPTILITSTPIKENVEKLIDAITKEVEQQQQEDKEEEENPNENKEEEEAKDSSQTTVSSSDRRQLTKENVKRFLINDDLKNTKDEEDVEFIDENMEFSFVCEPSNSDCEDLDQHDMGMESMKISPSSSSFEFQPPIVPVFKIDPPSAVARKCLTQSDSVLLTTMKRCFSDPMNCKMDTSEDESMKQNNVDFLDVTQSHDESKLRKWLRRSNNNKENEFLVPSSLSSSAMSIKSATIKNLSTISATKSLSNGLIGAGSTSGSNNNVGVDGVGVAKTKSSPFRRYGQLSSSFRSQLTANEAKKMLAANGEDPDRFYYAQQRPTSLAASEGDIRKPNKTQNLNTKSLQGPGPSKASSVDDKPVSVVEWSNSFEKILEDVYGLHAFAEFLKKEFSAENIYFWTACERYRKLDLLADRQREAKVIFERHLECGAPEPVNVDSQATSKTKEQLEAANPDLFSAAQKQIFNLMKFDSYARFIKSDVYKNCLDCELQKSPPPYPEKKSQFDVGLRTSIDQWPTPPTPIKLKKSLSNAEDRRRKSLLPWHRKTRSKSKERNDEKSLKNSNSNLVSNSDIHSSRSSLSSFDAVLSKSYDSSESSDIPRNLLCRVILADGATTIVQTRSTETIRELVDRLLEKRGIVYTCFEVFTSGNSKPCDLEGMSIQLAGKQVTIEQRVTFKMDLPNRKVISVKSKPIKMLEDVLRPILFKYNYVLENVSVFMKCDREPVISGEQQAVDLKSAVTTADGNRLQVIEKSVLEKQSRESGQNLDEITNKVFNELLQVKVDSQQNGKFDAFNNHRLSDQNSIRSGDDASLNIINRLKRIDNITSHLPIRKAPKVTSDELENGLKKPLIAKLTAGVRLQSPTTTQVDIETPPRHHHHYHNHVHQQLPQPSPTLLEGIKRAQKERLEDQRGTEINYELPEFLRNSRTSNGSIDSSEGRRFALQQQQRPKPAPRLSINKSMGQQNTSTSSASSVNNNSIDSGILSNRSQLSTGSLHSDFGQNHNFQQDDNNVDEEEFSNNNKVVFSLDRMIDGGEPTTIEEDDEDKFRAPPPLPPKPKILPIKPSNWGNSSVSDQQSTLQQNAVSKNAYLDQPTSSFV